MAQQQVSKQKHETEDAQVDEAPAAVETADITGTLDSIDDVLDQQLDEELLAAMDEVLHDDAEQFVADYIQEGGE